MSFILANKFPQDFPKHLVRILRTFFWNFFLSFLRKLGTILSCFEMTYPAEKKCFDQNALTNIRSFN